MAVHQPTDGNTLVRLVLTSVDSIEVVANGVTDPLARAVWGSVVEPRELCVCEVARRLER